MNQETVDQEEEVDNVIKLLDGKARRHQNLRTKLKEILTEQFDGDDLYFIPTILDGIRNITERTSRKISFNQAAGLWAREQLELTK